MINNPRAYLARWLRNYWLKPWLPRRRRHGTPVGHDLDLYVGARSGFGKCPDWFWLIVDHDPNLPRECAEVIRLRLDRETCDALLAFEEIGAELGINRDTASRRFARGMKVIRRMLEEEGEGGAT